ncbi:MAG: hypothetical protein ACM3JP_01065 [Betaproteobacteria bacterium]
MIRHIEWLSRPTPWLGGGAVGLSVYAEAGPDGSLRYRGAGSTGFEGVSCVDDVARAALLYCGIFRRRGWAWVGRSARGFLAFVQGMQDGDGRFANFIEDWRGGRNTTGPTSYSGGAWWTARALHALAVGHLTFREPVYANSFRRGLPWLLEVPVGSGAAAQAALAAIAFWRATADPAAADAAQALIARVRRAEDGGILIDDADADPTHVWGRYQEQALVRVGSALGRPDLVQLAQASADAVLAPAAATLPIRTPALPYEASCLARGLTAVAQATGLARYATLAAQARAWFTGRNAAGTPVYDSTVGRVYDGLDRRGGIVVRSENAGAESNVEAALALIDCLPWARLDQMLSTLG